MILDICVNECGMPRRDFIASFPKNETNLDWVAEQAKGKKPFAGNLRHAAKISGAGSASWPRSKSCAP